MIKIPRILVITSSVVLFCACLIYAQEPPAINPFGPPTSERDDAVPGYIELSDGSIHAGKVYLTRDKRLKLEDEQLQRQREIPLTAVKQIDCTIKKQWMEKEWKFKELAKDEKMYTGRSYPVREYVHSITLDDGRKISGGLSVIVYLQSGDAKAEQFILNKRNKGEIGKDLDSLVYVKSVKLGEEAFAEGKQKAAQFEKKSHNK